MESDLIYRRMFMITRDVIAAPAGWKFAPIAQHFAYYHPDLSVTVVESGAKTIALFGDVYDPAAPEKGNDEILRGLVGSAETVRECARLTESFAGCYALFFASEKEAAIYHDARGLREVYYSEGTNRVICASQPHLLVEYAEPKIEKSTDRELVDFYSNALWDSRWVGDETCFAGVKHLIPNHLFDIRALSSARYWPSREIAPVDLEDAVSRIAASLKGTLRAIVARHPAMMAVTAGEDSRVLFAASEEVQEKIYFFVNDRALGRKHPDIAVPASIFQSVGLDFNIHAVSDDVDEAFRRAFFRNTFLASERLLPSIHHLHKQGLGNRHQILGVSEIGRTFFGRLPASLSAFHLAYKLGYPGSAYVKTQCARLVPELVLLSQKFSVNAMSLFYWEQRLGNWGATRNSESLIAVEKIDPFNSHAVYATYLGVKEAYRNYQQSPCVISRELMRTMRPRLLDWPVNPPYSFRDRAKSTLSKTPLLNAIIDLKLHASRLIHDRKPAGCAADAAARQAADGKPKTNAL
jgi:hypothetical protein